MPVARTEGPSQRTSDPWMGCSINSVRVYIVVADISQRTSDPWMGCSNQRDQNDPIDSHLQWPLRLRQGTDETKADRNRAKVIDPIVI